MRRIMNLGLCNIRAIKYAHDTYIHGPWIANAMFLLIVYVFFLKYQDFGMTLVQLIASFQQYVVIFCWVIKKVIKNCFLIKQKSRKPA